MKIYHLSHTDLDGYACQFVVDFYFKNVAFFNSNYGKEISDNFDIIMNDIESEYQKNANERFLIIITDLNLTPVQCADFEANLQGKNARILLLDHHQSGEECAKNYAWYYLDINRCATKIVYEFFSQIYGENLPLKSFVDVVNSVDIWLKDEPSFELGKVCLGMISSAREINRVMFRQENLDYMFFLIRKAMDFMGLKRSHIALDDAIHGIKKEFFATNAEDTLSNLIAAFMVGLLSQKKDEFSLYYDTYKGILTTNIGNTSVIGNDFLIKNPEFDFFVDITSKKTLSFRANGKVDVSEMAKKLVGGGGHKNASGGLFMGFKDNADYKTIKVQVEDLIASKLKV